MSKAKIYGHPLSSPTKIATSVAKHLKVPFDFEVVDLVGGAQHDESFKKVNPNTKVPVLIEGDFTITESLAIAKYLCDKGEGTSLYPRDPKQRAVIDMHIAILNDLRMNQIKLNYLQVLEPKVFKKELNPTLIAQVTATVKKILGEYEALLNEDAAK